jgi:DNA repair protein RecN (Recombination protein N)
MIKSLQIKNYAIIEALEIDFSKGLTIITGETGAGKSILLGALGLIMGKRADIKSLYNLEKKCVVEGLFDIRKYKLKSFFKENDIDYDEELVIRREITPSGKSRAFINDTPVTLKELQKLSAALIDLHQQFDMLDIHNVSFQLRLIDALAENKKKLGTYQETYAAYQADQRKLNELRSKSDTAIKEREFILFQLEEFNKVELVAGEQEELEAELSRLTNAEDIKRTLSEAYNLVGENEQSVISQLEEVAQAINQVKEFDGRIQSLDSRMESLLAELQDLVIEFEKIAEDTEYDGERIQEVQERLDSIYRLQNKHQVSTVDDLLEIQKELEAKLEEFEDVSASIVRLEKSMVAYESQLRKEAAKLSERRKSVVPGFEKKVHKMLTQLSMEHARLEVRIEALDTPGPMGMDEVMFMFAANKGSRMQHIKDVASGGEISRLTLVTKSLVASAIPLPTLIFDEIDTGISGDVALKMGNIMRELSDHHQVVSITHSPQVASKADSHYFVYKGEKKDRTITKVRLLDKEERVRAIATMLSQSPPSDSAIENAKELLSLV